MPRTLDQLIAALDGVDLSLTDDDCRTLAEGLRLLKRRFLLFTGNGGKDVFHSAYATREAAVAEGAAVLEHDTYEAHVLDAADGLVVWDDLDHDTAKAVA